MQSCRYVRMCDVYAHTCIYIQPSKADAQRQQQAPVCARTSYQKHIGACSRATSGRTTTPPRIGRLRLRGLHKTLPSALNRKCQPANLIPIYGPPALPTPTELTSTNKQVTPETWHWTPALQHVIQSVFIGHPLQTSGCSCWCASRSFGGLMEC